MRRKNRRNRMSAFLAAIILTFLCFCQSAFAEEHAGIDPDQKVTLTIDLEAQNKCATIFIYKVGEWDGSQGTYVLTEAFSESGARIHDLTVSSMLQASEILEEYARKQVSPAIAPQTTTLGKAQFSDLTSGLYLICQRRGTSDNVTIQPYLTTLPVMNEETHVWDYDVKAYPKNESDKPDTPDTPGKPDKPDKPAPTVPDPTNPVPEPTPTPGSGGDRPDDPQFLQELTDGVVPRSGLQRMLDQIEDMMTPLAVLPRTADGSISYTALIILLAVSGTLVFCLIRKRRKR